MTVCGLFAGNPPAQILLRALAGLFAGAALGGICGWIGTVVVNDQLDKFKTESETPEPAPAEEIPTVGPAQEAA